MNTTDKIVESLKTQLDTAITSLNSLFKGEKVSDRSTKVNEIIDQMTLYSDNIENNNIETHRPIINNYLSGIRELVNDYKDNKIDDGTFLKKYNVYPLIDGATPPPPNKNMSQIETAIDKLKNHPITKDDVNSAQIVSLIDRLTIFLEKESKNKGSTNGDDLLVLLKEVNNFFEEEREKISTPVPITTTPVLPDVLPASVVAGGDSEANRFKDNIITILNDKNAGLTLNPKIDKNTITFVAIITKNEGGNEKILYKPITSIFNTDEIGEIEELLRPFQEFNQKKNSKFVGGNKHFNTIRNKHANHHKTKKAAKKHLSKRKRDKLNKHRKTHHK